MATDMAQEDKKTILDGVDVDIHPEVLVHCLIEYLDGRTKEQVNVSSDVLEDLRDQLNELLK